MEVGSEGSDRSTIGELIRDFRREQVVDAARRLFGERGSLDVSLGEIAEAAGVSRSTLYNHFTTREDVLAACLHAGQAQLVASVDAAVAAVDDPVERLVALLAVCIAHVDQSPAFFRMLTAVSNTSPPGTEAASVELSLTGIRVGETLRAVLADGVASGAFDVEVDAAVRLVGFVLVGLLEGRTAVSGPPPDELARDVVALLVRGFGTGARRVAGRGR